MLSLDTLPVIVFNSYKKNHIRKEDQIDIQNFIKIESLLTFQQSIRLKSESKTCDFTKSKDQNSLSEVKSIFHFF